MADGKAGHPLKSRLGRERAALDQCLLRDRRRLEAWTNRLALRGGRVDPRELDRLARQLDASIAKVDARRQSVPVIRFDDTLPVHSRRDAIAAAIAASQVVIVSGATGSGKSTQLPKICLELGRGVKGMIGHTQPRRIAAQALAQRIAEEIGTTTGDLVGYKVRFTDRTGPRTLVKLMTDGLLLRELESDPLLERYDTLILDEAHERNLNVDFLLGVCRQLVRRRPELRVIVTSATIETARFAEFFDGAPVVDVEGRSYPVEVRYRPLHEDEAEAPSLPEAVAMALDELATEGPGMDGDALVFLPGERQIAECRDMLARTRAADWEVLPLFSRLSAQEQQRIFAKHSRRRVVLATNVAETSLTIPGVRFVVDSGLARVSRYSPRSKFQRLPIEPVSQASADQRMGRCGRVAEGICIRLYAEDEFAARPRYTDPEILRTNLASLILQMAALGLGAPEDFPFLDAPDTRQLNDGYRLLQELSAVDGDRRITRLGRQMAGLPVDPRLARILLEAGRTGCLAEALVIAAFLSIQDPRERPADKADTANERHAQFADERSDFITVLNLWRALREQGAGGNRVLRRWCRENFLSFVRAREWQDLHEQLGNVAAGLELKINDQPAASGPLHHAILTGFLGGIGVLDEDRTYLGARDARFVIAPGTPLRKRSPRWVVAASLVETQRLYARMVAQVQPSWIEAAGAHLVRRTYSEAQWVPERGMVMARETVSLYGRVLSSGRQVNFAKVDPAMARRMFVEEALVRRQSALSTAFLERNQEARREIERLEAKLRRRDLLAHDDVLAGYYLERIPADISTTRSFEHWWRTEERGHPHRLDMPREAMLSQPVPEVEDEAYPDTWPVDGNHLPLHYLFDTSSPDDGVTLTVPLPLLGSLAQEQIDWLVPGMLREKVVALLRGLPKELRRELVPIPDAADRFLESLKGARDRGLFSRLAEFVTQRAGRATTADAFSRAVLPAALRLNLRVVDNSGHEIRRGRDLDSLQRELKATNAGAPVAAPGSAWNRDKLRRWDFGEIPSEVSVRIAGVSVRMYPGIEDTGDAVRLRLFPGAAQAAHATRDGVARLAAIAMPQQHGLVRRSCAADRELVLLAAASGMGSPLFDEIADRAVADVIDESGRGEPRSAAEFAGLVDTVRSRVAEQGDELQRCARNTLAALKEVRSALDALGAAAFDSARESISQQVTALLAPGWMCRTPDPWLRQLPKYLKAASRRAVRVRDAVERDRMLHDLLVPYESVLRELEFAGAGDPAPAPERERLRWMLEEFRVSLFAQELRTLRPVSAKRLDEQLQRARSESGRAA
ncbi:MAG: ATP-dependent RNA helicase HrpA [Steroidobacteraceae bacterium]|nr:ATP-dependent RNA helicase HrpA [Steroidobacteraceae bacterium]